MLVLQGYPPLCFVASWFRLTSGSDHCPISIPRNSMTWVKLWSGVIPCAFALSDSRHEFVPDSVQFFKSQLLGRAKWNQGENFNVSSLFNCGHWNFHLAYVQVFKSPHKKLWTVLTSNCSNFCVVIPHIHRNTIFPSKCAQNKQRGGNHAKRWNVKSFKQNLRIFFSNILREVRIDCP